MEQLGVWSCSLYCTRQSISLHDMAQGKSVHTFLVAVMMITMGVDLALGLQIGRLGDLPSLHYPIAILYIPKCLLYITHMRSQDAFGITAMYEAVRMGHSEVIEVLQKYDAK
eukprot:1155773-Pelagomonas_calceolata.AAC.6